MKMLTVCLRNRPLSDHRMATILSAHGLYSEKDVDRFITARSSSHPDVLALRGALGSSGVQRLRQRGSKKI